MMRSATIALFLALAGCAAVTPPPLETDYAHALLTRSPPAGPAAASEPRAEERKSKDRLPVEAEPEAIGTGAIDALLAEPFGADDLVRLADLQSAEIAASRANLEAARTGYRQAADLDDLVSLYRSFTRDLDTAAGPARHRRPAGAIAPSPNVASLSGEIVDRTVKLAREGLRTKRLEVAAKAHRTHAEVVAWAESRRIVAGDVALLDGLLTVLRARLETGLADQPGYLALSATVARRRTDLEVLDARAPSLRARLNRLLARPDDAPVRLDLVADAAGPGPIDAGAVVERALSTGPAAVTASLRAERAVLAVRMAETMTLPRFDIGSARFERERAGEAGVDRGPVFPDPGKMTIPRSDFGVREAQVTELRARSEALDAAAEDARLQTASAVRGTLFAVTAAQKRLSTLTKDVIPLAERALRASRGAYEGNRAGYLDLLEAARSLLAARLDRAGAQRDLSVARADLLVAAGFDPWKETDR